MALTPAEVEKFARDPQVIHRVLENHRILPDPWHDLLSSLGDQLASAEFLQTMAELKEATFDSNGAKRSTKETPARLRSRAAAQFLTTVDRRFGQTYRAQILATLKEHDASADERTSAWRKKVESKLASIEDKLSIRDGAVPTEDAAHCLLPQKAFRRYHNEYHDEKRRLARRVAKTCFPSRVRCFLQASTFIAHLADEIRLQKVGRGGLFHTNFACLASALLSGNEQPYQVYPVAGGYFDPICQGWYLANNDPDAESYVRELFTRAYDPLQFALLTPQYMTSDGSLHFQLSEAEIFASLLTMTAPRLVIVSPAPRIFPDASALEAKQRLDNRFEVDLRDVLDERRRNGDPAQVEILVCGAFQREVDAAAFQSVVTGNLGAKYSFNPGAKDDDWRVTEAPMA